MSPAEEHCCAAEYVRTKAPALAARLVVANMRLVVLVARHHCRVSGDMSDLVQEGNRGLVEAVERYDPERGIRLGTYAVWWIRAYMLKFTIDNWRLVRTGTTEAQRKLFYGLRKTQRRLEVMGHEVDNQQLAVALHVKETDVASMLERFAGGESSLDAPLKSQGQGPDTRTIGESLSAAGDVRPDLRIEDAEFGHILRARLEVFGASLQGRDANIFQRRLLTDEPVTLGELAAEFGVTRERTRQVELQLKLKLRAYLQQELGDALESPRAVPRRRTSRHAAVEGASSPVLARYGRCL